MRLGAGLIGAVAALACAAALAPADANAQTVDEGRRIFAENCATCHGDEARGERDPAALGFDFPLPDFTDCSFANREPDGDWLSVIHRGGPGRAFRRAMPAWDEALTEEEMAAALAWIRSLCADSPWPRGEFNIPLALVTEKAFPEDELLVRNSTALEGPTQTTTEVIYENRIGPRGQIEIKVPFSAIDSGSGTAAGFGDIALAWKQNVYASLETGAIVSLLGEVILPTGSESRGLGSGFTTFETHLLFAKLLPNDFFLQGQALAEFPTRSGVPDEAQIRLGFGRTFAEDEGWGRSWSPQIEFIAARPFESGAETNLDIVPQIQVSLSGRQHVLFAVGARVPLNNTADRDVRLMTYLLWDWYDAGFFEGW